MPDTIKVSEINRAQKLLCGRNVPHKIMYNRKPVQFLAKGGEMLNEYVNRCSSRWQRAYEKILPSEVYGNYFNYMTFDTGWTGTNHDIETWKMNYSQRRTIESKITTSKVTNKNIVKLINGYTIDGWPGYEHLEINPPNYTSGLYDKYRAMRHEGYSYTSMEFSPSIKGSEYNTYYRDVVHYTGYSICKEFLNSVNGWSVSFTMHLLYDEDNGGYTSQIGYTPVAMIRLADSTYTITTGGSIYLKYTPMTGKDSSDSYKYGDMFYSIKLFSHSDPVDPNTLCTQQKLYSYIQPDSDWGAVTDLHQINTSAFPSTIASQSFCDKSVYPRVTLTITCDKQTVKLYTNGELYGVRDISADMSAGKTFYDMDILFNREMTINSTTGEITSQTAKNTPYTKLYNLHVFNECLTDEQVETVFGVVEERLASPEIYKWKATEYPYYVDEKKGPTLNYEGGPDTEFDLGNAYYVLLWMTTAPTSPSPRYARYENITKQITWTFDDDSVFHTGGTTTAHASYVNGDFTWTQDYTITVSEP